MDNCEHVQESGRCEITMTYCSLSEQDSEICSCFKEKEEDFEELRS